MYAVIQTPLTAVNPEYATSKERRKDKKRNYKSMVRRSSLDMAASKLAVRRCTRINATVEVASSEALTSS